MTIKMTHGDVATMPILNQTMAERASLALLYWFGARVKHAFPKNPEMLKVYVYEYKHPTKGQPFLNIVIAACEREFNKTPPLIWRDYEDYCWLILKWLHKHGDVVTLERDDNCIPDV